MSCGKIQSMLGRGNVEKMMKKMNIKTNEIDAEKVIIKKSDGDIVIENPQVMLMNMMGRDVYQVTGDAREGKKEEKKETKEEDIKMVMEQTGHDRSTVESKLEELNNDLAKAIMDLKKKE